jgi:hypothetical protein
MREVIDSEQKAGQCREVAEVGNRGPEEVDQECLVAQD